jgi:hypothetical protein
VAAAADADALLAKAESLLGVPRSRMERLMVGLYEPGQQYAPHHDAADDAAALLAGVARTPARGRRAKDGNATRVSQYATARRCVAH